MNREQLTQVVRVAAECWQQSVQDALSRALGAELHEKISCCGASTPQERWEAIRFAIEQQSRELRERGSWGTEATAAARETAILGCRRDLATELGHPALDPEPWFSLVGRVRELRTSEKHIEQAAQTRQRSEDTDELRNAMGVPFSHWGWHALIAQVRSRADHIPLARLDELQRDDGERLARLRKALGLGSHANWDMALARVERWRDRYVELAQLWFGINADAPAIPSMGNLIRACQAANNSASSRQRSEDAAELRQILGNPGMRWHEILCRVADLASLARAIEAVAFPLRVRTAGAVTATADGAIERGDLVRTVDRSPLVDKPTP